eukprot:ANDGO_02809.mRNA.1 Spindle assembly checkpoint component mad1
MDDDISSSDVWRKSFPNKSLQQVVEIVQRYPQLEKEVEMLGFQVKQLEMKATGKDYDPSKTKVLHFSVNPETKSRAELSASEVDRLRSSNKVLQDELTKIKQKFSTVEFTQEAHDKLIKELEDVKKMNVRIKEMFRQKAREFRDAVFSLFGWKVDLAEDGVYRLQSCVARTEADILLFQIADGRVNMLESPFVQSIDPHILHVLESSASIPLFLHVLSQRLLDPRT